MWHPRLKVYFTHGNIFVIWLCFHSSYFLVSSFLSTYAWIISYYAGIRVQSLKQGQITMDIDFRWGGDPSIILGVEAAMVASIPIQVGVWFYRRLSRVLSCFFFLSHIIQEVINLDVAMVPYPTVERSSSFYCYTCYLPTCWRDTLHFCCCCCSTFWGTFKTTVVRCVNIFKCLWFFNNCTNLSFGL